MAHKKKHKAHHKNHTAARLRQPDLDAAIAGLQTAMQSVEAQALDLWRRVMLEVAFWESVATLPITEFLPEMCVESPKGLQELAHVRQLLRVAARREDECWERAAPGGYSAGLRNAVYALFAEEGGEFDSSLSAPARSSSVMECVEVETE